MSFFYSCEKDEFAQENTSIRIDEKELINFKGLTIRNRYLLTEDDLTTSNNDNYISTLKKVLNKKNRKKGTSQKSDLSINEIQLLQATEDMLPYFPYQNDGANLAMIQNDIPEITEENFEENSGIIEDYYNLSLNIAIAERYYDQNYTPSLGQNIEVYTENPPELPNFINITKEAGESTTDCFLRTNTLSLMGLSSWIRASLEADKQAKIYYGSLHTVNTKRDAFRHTLWNSLLSRYFVTVSSRKDKLDFAAEVSELNEQCGGNGYATRQMDYHNNYIGRIIYNQNTTFKKRLWMKIGLNQPSDAELITKVRDQIENKSTFIDFESYGVIKNEREEKAYFAVKATKIDISVYLSKELKTNENDGY